MFYLIEIELARCDTYTNGCGLAILIDSLKSFLKNYIEEFKRIVLNLKERKHDAKDHHRHQHPNQHLMQSATVPTNLSSSSKQKAEEEEEEDWETFRHFVKIIQIVGDLIET